MKPGVVVCLVVTALLVSPRIVRAASQEVEELKKQVQMLQERIEQLERREGQAVPAAAQPAPPPTTAKPGLAPSPAEEAEAKMREVHGHQSPVTYRSNLDDKQEAAPRPEDFTLDPHYRGFIPIPNTVFMMKFNPKPRVDMIFDTRNSGDDFRFVPAMIPTKDSPAYGGGERFNANGNGSQLRVDIRAPGVPGNFRFYYQNDFFGSDTRNFQYRLQHLYGQYYGIVAGFTYGLFEDPDAWPDTVDYEGPNAVVFARRPLVHYTFELPEDFSLTLGLEDPDSFVDNSGDPNGTRRTRAPDGGFNVRWEPGDLGHVQFSSIFRSVGLKGDQVPSKDVFGWGVDLSGAINVTSADTVIFYGVIGQGVGGMGNDTSFVNSDAAIKSNGDLVALDYVSGLLAYSHDWTPRWRSTATYGYADLQNTGRQPADAYSLTHYASVNLVYKVLKRLSVGVEGLYGYHRVHNGDNGDVFRVQVGMVYSLFD